uniref:Guanine deaminase n=1 Tax=Homalodisca liturata TaxID=320908 RepID=A0A1B6H569_9HEMI
MGVCVNQAWDQKLTFFQNHNFIWAVLRFYFHHLRLCVNILDCQYLAIIVQKGKILAVENIHTESEMMEIEAKYSPNEVVVLEKGQFLIPGLIDTHTHAPQFPNKGLGYDKTLLEWLNVYTFPLESKYEDENIALKVYTEVVISTLACGTTSAVYFATTHYNSSFKLAEIAFSKQQRAWIGRVNMDSNCPPNLIEDTEVSVIDTMSFIDAVQALNSDLVKPIITPRFAITSSASLLNQLGFIAEQYNLHIQTHLCETKEEIEEVAQMFPNSPTYTSVYKEAKLLTRKTILAHCVHLQDSEMEMIKDARCSIAHCPSSNINLRSGVCNVRRLLDKGINVCLGTDVAGGNSSSILDEMRAALNTSITLSFQHEDYIPLSYHEVFYMATMGGAIALDMEDKLGNFVVGKSFDALIVNSDVETFGFNLDISELFQKFIYSGSKKSIARVYVDGNVVM